MDGTPPDPELAGDPPNQTDGYLVLQQPAAVWFAWRWRLGMTYLDPYFDVLNSALPAVHPSRYRGMQRLPVERSWKENETSYVIGRANRRARRRLLELLGPDPGWNPLMVPFDLDLLPTVESAHEIMSLTDNPADHEILYVNRADFAPTPKTLGFDVGWWGSDHYSIIADAMLMPRWHGCPEEFLGELALWAVRLNRHMLFPTAAEATRYREWYLGQEWAEKGGERFLVIHCERVH